MQKRTGRFMATDDNGRQYNVDIYTDFVNVGNFESPNAVVEGLKELRTADGMAVSRLQKGEYTVVQTGVVIRSTSPDAP